MCCHSKRLCVMLRYPFCWLTVFGVRWVTNWLVTSSAQWVSTFETLKLWSSFFSCTCFVSVVPLDSPRVSFAFRPPFVACSSQRAPCHAMSSCMRNWLCNAKSSCALGQSIALPQENDFAVDGHRAMEMRTWMLILMSSDDINHTWLYTTSLGWRYDQDSCV